MTHDHDITIEQVQEDMMRRDKNDSSRTVAPLKAAADAVYVDTTDLSIRQVVDLMIAHVTNRLRQGIVL